MTAQSIVLGVEQDWIGVTMNDLIDRQDAIKAITQLPVKVDNLGYTWMIAGDVLKQIDDILSAEPKPAEITVESAIDCLLSTGWLQMHDQTLNVSSGPERKKGELKTVGFLTCQCSECGAQFHELEYTNFCPNCGAEMRGE